MERNAGSKLIYSAVESTQRHVQRTAGNPPKEGKLNLAEDWFQGLRSKICWIHSLTPAPSTPPVNANKDEMEGQVVPLL